MRVLVIDNYDSFTYNLVYIIRKIVSEVSIYRNDKITADECLEYDAIILSPGPGIPKDAGNLVSIIATCAGKVPILGVCLGHQAIAEYLGGELRMLNTVYHGIQSTVKVKEGINVLFNNMPQSFKAGRYHSWEVVLAKNETYDITALAEDDCVMAIQSLAQKLYGIQFHPESILTPLGDSIVYNFLRISKT